MGWRKTLTEYTLKHIVNVEVLQEVQDRFAAASGLGVIIANEKGEPITMPSNFTNFCSIMRSSKDGLQCCILSDQNLGLEAAQQGKPAVHQCHAGLLDLAAPIILNGEHLGAVLCGQVLLETYEEKKVEYIREQLKYLPLDQELLEQYFEEIEFTSQKRIESTLQMLQLVADYIVKIGAHYTIEQKLNNKSNEWEKELKKQIQLDSLLQETQLKLLQSQINSHFLFNTLNTISRIAYLENAEETQNVTYSLAKIMRYILRNVAEPVTLKEEMDYIQSYLAIQQSRFRNQLQYEQIIEMNTDAIKIPIFSIQPIIENAFNNWVESQKGEGVIRLHGFIKAGKVILEIFNTDKGRSEEKTSNILSGLGIKETAHPNGIGLDNVQTRMKHFFGEEYGITEIRREAGIGTTIQIMFPVKEVYFYESDDCRR